MVDTIHFPNAPIVEALLDIRVDLPKEVDLKTLLPFHDEIKKDFPAKKEQFSWQVDFKMGPGKLPESQQPKGGTIGYLFNSADGKKIVQATQNGFTFNMLKPYTDWKSFSAEAKALWQKYIKIAKPVKVSRIALRYINRIEIPFPFNAFKEYILTIPEIAQGIPNGLSEFLMRLVIPMPEMETTAIITETIDKMDNKTTKLPLIFDIDVYKMKPFEPSSDNIWTEMEHLHKFKNDIFFNSLTDKTKELFK
ncbi:MAG: TIGR04255 family protein [Planctomycetes bacterium]|nr:TIGR04255 family protein [Planctomycetota bacterium]